MRKLLTAFTVLLALQGCTQDPEQSGFMPLVPQAEAQTPEGQPTTVMFGDSHIASFDASLYLPGYAVANAGLAGSTVYQSADRFAEQVLAQDDIEALIFMQGVNDLMLLQRTPAQIVADIEALVLQAHNKGIHVYLLGVMPAVWDLSEIVPPVAVKKINDKLDDMAAIYNMTRLDAYHAVGCRVPYTNIYVLCERYSEDGLHLNDLGKGVLADLIRVGVFGE